MSENISQNDDLLFYSTISFCSNHKLDPELLKLIENGSYNLIVTGTLGVGKTTAIKLINNILKYNHISVKSYLEYINYNNVGQEIFQMKMNGEVSAFTFQNYILDIWNDILKKNDFKHSKGINIFERLPYDAVYCFSKKEHDEGNITDDEYELIIQRYKRLINEHAMFEYTSDIKYSRLINNDMTRTIVEIFNIIKNDIEQGIKNRCICLDIDDKELYYERLGIRNRTNEDKYTQKILGEYKDYYYNSFINK